MNLQGLYDGLWDMHFSVLETAVRRTEIEMKIEDRLSGKVHNIALSGFTKDTAEGMFEWVLNKYKKIREDEGWLSQTS